MAAPALSSVPRSVCRQQRWHCGREECAGTCVATGDPHYVTFDGRAFSFPGDCEYLLARETTGLFTVTAENVPCGTSGVTCTKSVVVVMGNTVVHMLRGEGTGRGCRDGSPMGTGMCWESPPLTAHPVPAGRDVTVNGVSVRPPKIYSGTGLTLERAGLFLLLLLSRLGLAVLWDGGETCWEGSGGPQGQPCHGGPLVPSAMLCYPRHEGVRPAGAAAPGPRGRALREL